MTDSVDLFLKDYHAVLIEAGKTASDVERLEEQRRVAFSEQIIAARKAPETKVSVAEAEHIARTSEPYSDAVARLDVAREKAAEAKAKAIYYEARFDAWRTKSATKRAEIMADSQK